MRLFYALTFNKDGKSQLSRYRDLLADRASNGRFTLEDNFHITLAFLGECYSSQLKELRAILDYIDVFPGVVRVNGLGSFNRKGKKLYWLGIERQETLIRLQKQLTQRLKEANYDLEIRKYTPHITLGRDVELQHNCPDLFIDNIELKVNSIALVGSRIIDGTLVYQIIDELHSY